MISIIIPVYNVENYIERAFNSLLKQSIGFENLEIIFVDDGSTDQSPKFIQNYVNAYENVKAIFLDENSGSGGKPRNIGIQHSSKDYLMFLDSDDVLMEDACETLYNEIIEGDLDIVGGTYTLNGTTPFEHIWLCTLTDPNESMHDRKEKINRILNEDFPLIVNSMDEYESIIGDFCFVSKIYRKSFLVANSIEFSEGIIGEDSVFILNALLNAKGIKYIDKIIYWYTQERNKSDNFSLSYDNSKDNLKSMLDAFFKMYDLSVSHGKSDIFKHYLLIQKLDYFLETRLFKSNLIVDEVLDLLIYSEPLFKLYVGYNNNVPSKLAPLYNFIAQNDWEIALKFIFGDEIITRNDISQMSDKKFAEIKSKESIESSPKLKISIIIPVYNVEKYLRQCLDSIINQKFKDIEIICVNDGSTDNSLEILNEYAKKDSRFKILTQENNGQGHARNVGLTHAHGDYILFVDADDYLSENSLEQVYQNAILNDSDLVIFEFYQFDEDKNKKEALGDHLDKIFGDVDYNNLTFSHKEIKMHVMNSFFPVWFKLIKREFLNKHDFRFPVGIAYEDVLFHVQTLLFAEKISFLPKYVYNYRLSNNNSTMSDKTKIFDIIKVVDSVEKFLKESSLFKEYETEFYRFKITQLTQYIFFWEEEEYYKSVKMEFIVMDQFSGFDFNKLPMHTRKLFDNVLKSRDLNEYLILSKQMNNTKIVSITQVKNESDIIESFIRYHLNIVDEMIILDNGSTDETSLIINNLINEDLPIKLIEDTDSYHTQNIKMTSLLNKAVKEQNADIVLVLDVDEFIVSDDAENPRKILEKINPNNYYLVKWKTYIPTPTDNYYIRFIPQRITHLRDENLEQYNKVIVPKEIVNNYNVSLDMGNHDLIFKKVDKSKLVKKDLNLKIAHFPLRSKEQCISKISIGWPNTIAINMDNKPWSFHWKILFEKIKENNDITSTDLEDFAKNYALTNHLENIPIKNQPINLDFCRSLEIKYDFKYNYLKNILENYVYFADEIISFKRKIENRPKINDKFINTLISDLDTLKKSGLFETEWYVKKFNPNKNIDPIMHYLLTWRENMNDPANFFSTEYYFKTHKDVAKAGMNPFVHYVKYGMKEKRRISASKK